MDLLAIPWVDKTIYVVASLPFAVELYRRWVVGQGVPLISPILGNGLAIVSMGLRGLSAGSPLAVVPRRRLMHAKAPVAAAGERPGDVLALAG